MTDDVRQWTSQDRPIAERVALLMAEMTISEKIAQLGSARPTSGTVIAAPGEEVFAHEQSEYDEGTKDGLGQLTRVLGSKPIDPTQGARRLAELQADLVRRTRLGIPAVAHEECLSGFTTYGATIFPTPLAWAASFDPVLVERMARAIGEGMVAAGVRQGLAPVLDVVRDHRWGRVEETLGEDPLLVGTMACAYVTGLQDAGVIATLKHFAGYSASRAGRNNAPVSMGLRELRDVILFPFEMAVTLAGAKSVMHAYNEIDCVPAAANAWLLTDVLRGEWGFEGVVVSDYWGIPFLATTHGVAADDAAAGRLALMAGVDVELPGTRCFGPDLAAAVERGDVPLDLVDRATHRVLLQKAELGYLDAEPPISFDADNVELDTPETRAIARDLARESVILLKNDAGVLPIAPGTGQIAVIGPCADDPTCLFGCYSFPRHVLERFPGHDQGVTAASVLDGLRQRLDGSQIVHAQGCDVSARDTTGILEAVRVAASSDLVVLVVGDRAGLFGTGTSGEGCDVEDLALPGVQGELVDAVLETGTPTILVVIAGRPYALGAYAARSAAIVTSFFPGQEGGLALADVLTGASSPSGRLPVQIPDRPGGAPATYLHPILGGRSDGISNLDPTPLFAFGHGLTYTEFTVTDVNSDTQTIGTDGRVTIRATVANVGARPGVEVVQLYATDVAAEVTRPVRQLIGFARVHLEPGLTARVDFEVSVDVLSFTGLDFARVVEPGFTVFHVSASATQDWASLAVEVTGPRRVVGRAHVRTVPVAIVPLGL